MGRYVIRRLVVAVPTLIAISLVIFTILALAPGDPLGDLAMNPAVPPEVQQRLRESMGLEDPVPVRYARWATSLASGDFGYSFQTRSPVSDLLAQRLPISLLVLGSAYLLAILIAIPVGVISSVKQYSTFDNVATTFAFIGFSIPTFFTGLLFILIFSVYFGNWGLPTLPSGYRSTVDSEGLAGLWERFQMIIMPVTVLGLFQAAQLTRYTRAAMLETIHQDYVRTARAKGLTGSVVVFRHALRNALIPVITIIAIGLPTIFTGAVVTEQIFRIPGVGALLISSIQNNDTPVVMSVTFLASILIVLFNLVADVLYGVLDPRIRYE